VSPSRTTLERNKKGSRTNPTVETSTKRPDGGLRYGHSATHHDFARGGEHTQHLSHQAESSVLMTMRGHDLVL
jgi:hypothetical protein